MKDHKDKWVRDVEGLTQESVETEAAQKVWERLETALASLSNESRAVLDEYFAGHTPKEISQALGLHEGEVIRWIEQGKRELSHQLRNQSAVRQ